MRNGGQYRKFPFGRQIYLFPGVAWQASFAKRHQVFVHVLHRNLVNVEFPNIMPARLFYV